MANKKELQRESSSKKILDSALYEFAEKGYSNAKLSDIATRASVAYGLLSQRFGSKENLYNEVLYFLVDYCTKLLPESNTIEELLSCIVDIIKKRAMEDHPGFRFMVQALDSKDAPQSGHWCFKKAFVESGMEQLFAQGIVEGKLTDGIPYDLFLTYVKTCMDVTYCFTQTGTRLPNNTEYIKLITSNAVTEKGRRITKANDAPLSAEELRYLARDIYMKDYDTILLVDCEKNSYRLYHDSYKKFKKQVNLSQDYEKDLKVLMSIVSPEDRHIFAHIADCESLRQFMATENRGEISYHTLDEKYEWMRCYVRVLARRKGVPVRVMLCFKRLDKMTSENLDFQKKQIIDSGHIMKCIELFDGSMSDEKAIRKLLEYTLDYYSAERIYIREMDPSTGDFGQCIGIESDGSDFYTSWLDHSNATLKKHVKEFVSRNNDKQVYIRTIAGDKLLHNKLTSVGVDSVIFSSFYDNDKLAGYVAVDNPTRNADNLGFLRIVSTLSRSEMSKVYRGKVREAESNLAIANLADDYEGIIHVKFSPTDKAKDEATIYRISKSFTDYIPGWRKEKHFSKRLELLCDYAVHPDNREAFIEDTHKEKVLEALNSGSAYYVTFRVLLDDKISNYEMKFIADRDPETKEIKGMIVGLHNTDEEINLAKDQENERARYASVIRVLSAEYSSVLYYNPDDEVVVPYSMSERISNMLGNLLEGKDIIEVSAAYIENGVLESDKDEMTKSLSVENILENLSRSSSFTKIYLNNEGKYCEMKVAKADEDSDAFVIGFAVKDDMIRSARRQENAMYEIVRVLYEETDIATSLDTLLSIITRYYDADRACIMEVNRERTGVTIPYRYSHPGVRDVHSTANQFMAISSFEDWFDEFKNKGAFFADIADEDFWKNKEVLGAMRKREVNAIIAAPVIVNGELMGFINIENPENSVQDLLIVRIAAATVYSELLRRKESEEEQKTLSKITDSYASVCFVDLSRDYIHPYSASDRYESGFLGLSSYREAVDKYIEVCVAKEDKARLKAVMEPGYIIDRLSRQEYFVVDYVEELHDQKRNFQFRFTRVDKEGFQLVISSLDNTDTLAKERENHEKLKNAMERAESANRAKSEFLSRMSHDIRTPINGVIGMTAIAQKYHDDDERLMDCLGKIDVASHHLLSLINDVLDMSRIESGKVVIAQAPYNIMKFVENCALITEGQMEDRSLEFIRDFGEIEHPDIIGDELHLRQVILNILGNAIKFTHDGGHIIFRMREENYDGKNVSFAISIEDNGIGMKPEYLSHIWEAFNQESPVSARTNYKGTGLGMAISKQLVELMGGTISVESEYAVGTTFTVTMTLPVNVFDSEKEKEDIPVSIKNTRILLVEDNDINIEIAKEILTSNGAESEIAENGQIAVEMFAKSKPYYYDAVLMDVMMPVMDGLEATRRIRSMKRKDAMFIPVIAMTANAFDEDIKKTEAAGMDAHLSKPIQVQQMLKTLSDFIHRKNMARDRDRE